MPIDTLPIVRTVADLRAHIAGWAGESVALVPTMGALHAGHISLVSSARAEAARVVATIFVNPRQFGPGEDLDSYPRTEAADVAALTEAGCDLLFAPAVAAIYPPGFATKVAVSGLGDVLDGAARPGHFDGVATIVTKLLLAARPNVAWFGEKDWQQLTIIRRMVADLDIGVDIRGGAIVRDADGLALSSRNIYLSPDERARVTTLPVALTTARDSILAGAPVEAALAQATASLVAKGFDAPDYVTLVGADDLQPMTVLDRAARLLAAARIGRTRLIDNLAVG